MKSISKNLIVGLAAIAFTSEARAVVTLSLEPISQSIGVGNPAAVALIISGLDDLASLSLGAFDIDLTYNSAVVTANSLSFGSGLDLGTFGSVRFSNLGTPGLIHLDEVSLEAPDDLNAAQPDSFTLATFGFSGLSPGLSPLVFGATSLSDVNGNAIDAFAINTGLIEVKGSGVPDAGSTGLLLATGIGSLSLLRRRTLVH
jgi:hypothetical protein